MPAGKRGQKAPLQQEPTALWGLPHVKSTPSAYVVSVPGLQQDGNTGVVCGGCTWEGWGHRALARGERGPIAAAGTAVPACLATVEGLSALTPIPSTWHHLVCFMCTELDEMTQLLHQRSSGCCRCRLALHPLCFCRLVVQPSWLHAYTAFGSCSWSFAGLQTIVFVVV